MCATHEDIRWVFAVVALLSLSALSILFVLEKTKRQIVAHMEAALARQGREFALRHAITTTRWRE